MSVLHTVNKSPFDKNSLESCLRVATDNSSILLIEDGVYAALKETTFSDRIKEKMNSVHIYALWPDIEARGMQERVIEGIKLIGYDGFVDLTTEHDVVQSWL